MYAECNGFGLRHTALGMHPGHVFCKCDCKHIIGGDGVRVCNICGWLKLIWQYRENWIVISYQDKQTPYRTSSRSYSYTDSYAEVG